MCLFLSSSVMLPVCLAILTMVSYACFTRATLKYSHSDDMYAFPARFGFKGEALNFISDVSLLEIVTKAHGRPNGYCKVLKDGKCLYLEIVDCRQDDSTIVIVRDVFTTNQFEGSKCTPSTSSFLIIQTVIESLEMYIIVYMIV